MPQIHARVLHFIRQEGMPLPGTSVLVALSGGADSVALLLLLEKLGYQIHAAHCNFGLRKEAADDEAFVSALTASKGIPLKIWHFGPQDFARYSGEGLQQAARKLRYEAFETFMAAEGIQHCATGHHADDQTETLLLSFFRANGPRLLQGIPAVRGPYFRPLLGLTKLELTGFLTARTHTWRHDASNDTDQYTRNLVRNQLVPALKALHPRFQERFQAQARRAEAQWALMSAVFEPLLPDVTGKDAAGFWISIDRFGERMGQEHFPVFLDWRLETMGFLGTEIHEIQRLVSSDSGATYRCVRWEVLRDRDCLRFRESATGEVDAPRLVSDQQALDCELDFAGFSIRFQRRPAPGSYKALEGLEVHWLNWSALTFPLRLRRWGRGDRYEPLGLHGTKKLSDIFIDQKRDLFSKERAWVLEDANGIVLVGGYRIAGRVAIPEGVTDVLCIEVGPSV